MICPFMTQDPVKDPKPCVESCALRFKNACSLNVAAQSIYHQAVVSNRQEKSSEKA
mgnify:CR=1 FL=1